MFNINVQTSQFKAGDELVDLIKTKVKKLDKFYNNISQVDVFLKLESKSKTVNEKTVEMKLAVPNKKIFVKNKADKFEKAFDLTLKSTERQLKKYNQKLKAA